MRFRTGCLILAAWLSTGLSIAQNASAYQRGVQLYNQAQYSEALDAFTQAIVANPKDSNAYRQRARCRQRLEDLKGALADFDEAIEIDPRNARALSDRSTLKRRLKDLAGALDDINRAIEADPKYAGAYNNRGLLRWDAKDYKGALADYDYSVSLDPKQSPVFNNRGLVKEKLNDFAGALADYTKAIENNPKNADAYSNRAFCRKQMGDTEAARLDYQSALTIEPAHKFATTQLKKLEAESPGLPTAKTRPLDQAQKMPVPPSNSTPPLAPPKTTGPTSAMRFGDFALQAPAGWERAPSDIEKRDKTWQIADVKGSKNPEDPLIVAFPFENVPFNDEKKRLEYLSVYKNNVRKSHAQTLSSEKVTLAGVEFERLRFKDKDGRTTFYLTPYNGAKVYHIYVFRPDGLDAFPDRALELLSSLKLAGPEYRQPTETTRASSTTQPVASPTDGGGSAAVPVVQFKASDPCEAAKTTAGLPWQSPKSEAPATPPPGIPAATLAPFLDFNKLSAVQYNGAVSVAMEGMRLLYGEMSAEDERKFQAAWAPLFDYPTPAMVDYLNKLNPLLGQFLAGREAFTRAAAAVNAAMYDAALAVAADTRDAYVDALARADRQGQVLRSLEAGLAQVAAQIQALGNPPNPLAAKCEAQRHHHRRVQKPAAAPEPGSATIWSGTFECTSCAPCNAAGIRQNYAKLEERIGGNVGAVKAALLCGPQPFFLVRREHPGRQYDFQRDQFILYAERGRYFGVRDDNWSMLNIKAGASELTADFSFPGGYNDSDASGRVTLTRGTESVPMGWSRSAAATLRSAASAIEAYQKRGPNEHTWLRLSNFDMDIDLFQKTAAMIDRFNEERSRFIQASQAFLQLPASKVNPQGNNFPAFKALFDGATPADTAPSQPVPTAPAEDKAAVEETIAFHQSMIELLNRNLQKEQADLNQEVDPERLKQLAFRAIQLQSDIQAEQDLVASYQTGQIVHTRSAFDEFASDQFIYNIRQEAARMDTTRRIAAVVEEQIEQAPEEERAALRQKARSILDAKTIGSGDVERAAKLAESLGTMIQGYREKQAATEEEKAIDKAEMHFYFNSAVMVAGVGVIGLGSAALAATYGETAAVTIWGPHIIGGIYGGAHGLMAGGPVEGAKQAIAWSSPVGFLATSFADGFVQAGENPKAGWEDALWAGAKQAGTGYLIGKAMQFGAGLTAKGTLSLVGEDSLLFKPLVAPRPNVTQAFAAAKMQQDVGDALSLINNFKGKQAALAKMRAQLPAGSPELAAAEKELKQLAASLNSSYHCKLLLKYHAHPSVRRYFSSLVDKSYEEATPEMLRILKSQGYDVSNLRFKSFRNSSSAGSSSMDLDLALQETPNMVILKNGKRVEVGQFQEDAQKALNEAYHKVTGFSATRSEVNLTTSAHLESYKTTALLRQKVNFSKLTPDEIASIGKVLGVKLDKIQGDPVLSQIAKMQAQCRESAKEIENMLLKDLKQKLAKAPAGSPEAQQTQADINYWTDMLKNFRQISMQETNPYRILELDRAIRALTGGKGSQQVSRDLARAFNH